MRHPGRSDGTHRPTIEDVAAKARVSTATVSRALRFPEQVSATLRGRVQWAVSETGYTVNVSARALSTLRTGVVGIVTSKLAPHAAVVAAAIRRLAAFGLATCVAECGVDADDAVAAMID